MNSTIMVHNSIKNPAAAKAKADGLSLSTVIRFLLKAYTEGKLNIGLIVNDSVDITNTRQIALDQATQDQLETSVKKWRTKIEKK